MIRLTSEEYKNRLLSILIKTDKNNGLFVD